jgi:GNAT superfamily N-acetyltransferase
LVAIRASRPDEMLLIRPLVEEYHRESRYAHIPFSETKFKRNFLHALNNPDNTLAVYIRHDGKAVGMMQAGVGEYYLGDGGRIATVHALYVSKRIRGTLLGGKVAMKLMRIVADWANEQRAEELHMHSTSGIATRETDRLLRRMGFRTVGGFYVTKIAI